MGTGTSICGGHRGEQAQGAGMHLRPHAQHEYLGHEEGGRAAGRQGGRVAG